MRIKAFAVGSSAAVVAAIAFGICGAFFAIAPSASSAFASWLLHVDLTGMTRSVSAGNLIGGTLLFAAYVGVLVGSTAALYNRVTEPRT